MGLADYDERPDKRPPGTELAIRRLGEIIDGVAKTTMSLEERTAAVRLVMPTPPSAGDERGPRPAGSDLANTLQAHADQLEQALAKLVRIEQEIDL